MAKTIRERFTPPWTVEEIPGGYKVVSSNGFSLAYIYALEGFARSANPTALTDSEARAIATAIADLPEKANS